MTLRALSIPTSAVAVLSALAATLILITAQTAHAQPTTSHVVLIGVPGLRWSDIDEEHTPRLWELLQDSAAGSLSVRTPQGPGGATCPIAGWLTVSSGEPASVGSAGCGRPPTPIREGEAAQAGNFDALQRVNAHAKFSPELGVLGQAIHDVNKKTAAIGPGAALAAADKHGFVDRYVSTPTDLTNPEDYALIVADVDNLLPDGELGAELPDRPANVRAMDKQVGDVLRLAPQDATVLVAGISDDTATQHLHVAMAKGPAFLGSQLTANSTHQQRLVTINDLTVTTLENLGINSAPPGSGRPWRSETGAPQSLTTFTKQLSDEDLAARAGRAFSPKFIQWLFTAQLALYALVSFVLWRINRGAKPGPAIARGVSVLAVLCAGAPVAATLANAVPWWQPADSLAEACISQALALLIADLFLAALAFAGPWRRHILGPPAAIAVLTLIVLGTDVVLGMGWQTNSPTGYGPLNAGRFYGFGNMSFTLVAVATLIVLAGIANVLSDRRRYMLMLVILVGVGAVILDGAPMWGADFGGVIALAPALAVCVMLLAGVRISATKLGLIAFSGLVVIMCVAWLDSLRPPAKRTHLGAFFADLLAGHGGGEVVDRKFTAMLHSFRSENLVYMAGIGVLFAGIITWLLRAEVKKLFTTIPSLSASLIGVTIVGVLGLAVNDSGVAVPAITVAFVLPLVLSMLVESVLAKTYSQGKSIASNVDMPPSSSGSERKSNITKLSGSM